MNGRKAYELIADALRYVENPNLFSDVQYSELLGELRAFAELHKPPEDMAQVAQAVQEEKLAWEEILFRFKEAVATEQREIYFTDSWPDVEGICEGIQAMSRAHTISPRLRERMEKRLQKYKPDACFDGYWWPRNIDGHRERVKALKKIINEVIQGDAP